MIYIVGDIHGEITKLERLIKIISSRDNDAEYVFVGDYIDKGENVERTLSYLEKLRNISNCVFLYGNHEYLWLKMEIDDFKTKEYLLKYGGQSTIKSMRAGDIWEARQIMLAQFNSFFEALKTYWKNEQYVVVHSGIAPHHYKCQIEDIPVSDLLFNRYDFIKSEEFYLNKYRVIFGHTGFYSPYVDPYKIGIDTGAYFSPTQPITALCLDENLFIDSGGNVYPLIDNSEKFCPNIPR